jgi:hypothetical protein
MSLAGLGPTKDDANQKTFTMTILWGHGVVPQLLILFI